LTAATEIRPRAALPRVPADPRARWQLLVALVLIVALMAPMLFTDSTFGGDWPGHLWLVQMQARNIEFLGHPSFFVQSTLGAFEPWFAFYGGTLYSLVGGASVASGGHTLAAYIASFALAMAMAYGGFVWLARQAGIRGWPAHVPALVFLTSAYYVSDVYARGAWPETVATSSMPLLAAAGLCLLRDDRWRVGPVIAFVVSAVIFTGSHNLTLLYGTIFLVLLCAALGIAFGRGQLPRRERVLGVVGLGALAVGVNLWFLLPDVAYQGHTTISHSFVAPPAIKGGMPPGLTLDPIRHSRLSGDLSTLDLQIPTLALVWALATLAFCWRELAPVWRRLALALALVGVVFYAPILVPELWHAVPKLFWAIQFPYRLLTYVDFAVVGLVTLATVALVGRGATTGDGMPAEVERSRTAVRALVAVGVVFALVEVGQAIGQQWATQSSLPSRAAVFPGGAKLPDYWIRFATYLEFQDVSEPVVSASIPELPGTTVYNGQGANIVPVPVLEQPRSSYTVTLTPPRDGTVNTDVIAGPYLVAVHGARFVGRTPYSELVMSVKKNPSGPTRVTFSTARTWPIVVGKWASVVSVLAIALLLALFTLRGLRRRARDGSSRVSRRRQQPS
jgi:hypothetical protein